MVDNVKSVPINLSQSITEFFSRFNESRKAENPTPEANVEPVVEAETPLVEETVEETIEPVVEEKSPLEIQLESLQKELSDLRSQITQPAAKEEKATEPVPLPELPMQDYITQEEFDAAVSTPEALNALLHKVGNAAFQSACNWMHEMVLRTVPALTAEQINRQQAYRDFQNMYYNTNKDIYDVKDEKIRAIREKVTADVSNTLMRERPELMKNPEAAAVAIGEGVRYVLGLKKPTGKVEPLVKPKVAIPPKPHSQAPKPAEPMVTPQQKETMETLGKLKAWVLSQNRYPEWSSGASA